MSQPSKNSKEAPEEDPLKDFLVFESSPVEQKPPSTKKKKMTRRPRLSSLIIPKRKKIDSSWFIEEEHKIKFEEIKYPKNPNIGHGVFAHVKKCFHTQNGKKTPYALKVIQTSEKRREMILREIQILRSLNCNHIVKIHEAYNRDGAIQLLLEYMNVGNVCQVMYILEERIPVKIISKMTYQMLLALCSIEKGEIVHRDIKPSNILINSRGYVKLADFGSGKKKDHKNDIFKTPKGTYFYMSPERINEKEHSYSSDIWSLGVCVWEWFLGYYPFQSETENLDITFFLQSEDCLTKSYSDLEMKTGKEHSDLFEFIKLCTKWKDRPNAAAMIEKDFIINHNEGMKELLEILYSFKTKKLNEKEQILKQKKMEEVITQNTRDISKFLKKKWYPRFKKKNKK